MPNFQYKALDAKGDETIGSISAANEAEAVQQIRALNLHPTQIAEEGKGKLSKSKTPAAKGKAGGKAKAVKGSVGGRIKPK
ncbi:MAG: type II secretion system F family protein, partial [Verrucomicrobiaceae bacterium]